MAPLQISEIGPRFTIIERRIEQGVFWRELFPESGNTIRVLTLWTPGEVEPFIARAVQRIGTAATVPTDNWSGGGICAPIDLVTGRLGEGRMHPTKGKRQERRFTHHPDTGAQIEGAVLPHWDEIKATALRAAASLPANRYVGWDVIVDHMDRPVILEGNSNTNLELVQLQGGLLADPAIRRFYADCGVL